MNVSKGGGCIVYRRGGALEALDILLCKICCQWHDGVYFIKSSLTCRGSFGCSQAAVAADVASVSRSDG